MRALRQRSHIRQEQRAPLRWGSCRGFREGLPVTSDFCTRLPRFSPELCRGTPATTHNIEADALAKLPSIFLRKKGDRLHLAPRAFGMVCPGSEGSSRGLRFGVLFASQDPRFSLWLLLNSCPHADPPVLSLLLQALTHTEPTASPCPPSPDSCPRAF